MKRLTTDDSTSILQGLNLFFAKDKEVWIRGGGPEPDYQDCTLVDWINRAAAAQEIELEADDAETMGDVMYDCLQFGCDITEGILALLHAAAVQAAEMRGRLKLIEDILGDDYDLDRLRELAEAVRAKRLFAIPVLPSLQPGLNGSEVFILSDSGEIVQDNVCSIEIGPNSSGEVDMLFATFDNCDFDYDDVGKRIFWKIEDARKAAAALKEYRTVKKWMEQNGNGL